MAASLKNAGVCILSASAPQPQVDAAGLQAKGLRVRTVSTCVADVLLASASLAILVTPSADLEPGAADADRQWDRCNIQRGHAAPSSILSVCCAGAQQSIPRRCEKVSQDISRYCCRVQSLSKKGFRSALVIVHGSSSPQLKQRIISETSKYA